MSIRAAPTTGPADKGHWGSSERRPFLTATYAEAAPPVHKRSTQTAPQLPTFEPRWPAALAVLAAIGLYASLPSKLISDEHASGLIRFVVPALELALLIPLAVTAPYRHVNESGRRRKAAITLIAV